MLRKADGKTTIESNKTDKSIYLLVVSNNKGTNYRLGVKTITDLNSTISVIISRT